MFLRSTTLLLRHWMRRRGWDVEDDKRLGIADGDGGQVAMDAEDRLAARVYWKATWG